MIFPGSRHRRGYLIGCAGLALCLLASGCSKTPAASSKQTHLDPCGGLKAADAATILKVPPSDIDGPRTSRVFSCRYHSKSHPLTTLSFNLYAEDSAARATEALASEKQGFSVLSPISTVEGLGDEAYRAPDSRVKRLLVRKGRIWLDVVTPGDAASQRQIAQIVLSHLP